MYTTLLLYLAVMSFGVFIGSKKLSPQKNYKWIGKIQLSTLILLIFIMGIKIGADDQVVRSFKTIGLNAFVIAVFALLGSVLCVYIGRRVLGFDKRGMRE